MVSEFETKEVMDMCSCPTEFDKTLYDGKEHTWDGMYFYSITMPLIYHVPIFQETVLKRLTSELISKSLSRQGDMILQKDAAWLGKLLVPVSASNDPKIKIFPRSRIYSSFWGGPWNQVSVAIAKLRKEVEASGDTVDSLYLWYASCPECLDANGYRTVIFALLEPRIPIKVSEPSVKYVEPAGEGL